MNKLWRSVGACAIALPLVVGAVSIQTTSAGVVAPVIKSFKIATEAVSATHLDVVLLAWIHRADRPVTS